MPCTYEDFGQSAREATAENNRIKAALCGVLSTMTIEEQDEVFRQIDYVEAGITKKWLKKWWYNHQAEDEIRREKELEKLQNDRTKAAALAKLTDEEKYALGLVNDR